MHYWTAAVGAFQSNFNESSNIMVCCVVETTQEDSPPILVSETLVSLVCYLALISQSARLCAGSFSENRPKTTLELTAVATSILSTAYDSIQ